MYFICFRSVRVHVLVRFHRPIEDRREKRLPHPSHVARIFSVLASERKGERSGSDEMSSWYPTSDCRRSSTSDEPLPP